jgi:hypothetical protein
VLVALLRTTEELGPLGSWLAMLFALVVIVILVLLVIAFWSALHPRPGQDPELAYRIFRALLALFDISRRRK